MQTKKAIALFLAFFILTPNLGLAFNVHYCHNEIASVSLKYDFVELLNPLQNSCCEAKGNCGKCCSNKVVEFNKASDNFLQDGFQFKFQQAIWVTNIVPVFSVEVENYLKTALISNSCDANAPPLYKLFCQFIFYA